jgi:phosphate transport system protein
MPDKHLSSEFDADLGAVSNRVMEMGGLVESQFAQAMVALSSFSPGLATQVLGREALVNRMEVEIDHELSGVIARRQPAARDLRLLIAVSKGIANLERVGDEAARIARTVDKLITAGMSTRLRQPVADLVCAAKLATMSLRRALDAFARLDTARALEVLQQDEQIDQEFDGLLRTLITCMMEDPRTISACIDLVFVAKAIERVGDHAKNLAEAIIYVVKGTDVRHASMETVENAVR